MKDQDKIYISLPMGGHEKTVRRRYEEAADKLRRAFGDNIKISGPLNIDDFDDDGYIPDRSGKREHPWEWDANGEQVTRDHPWEWYIGEDVKELLTCGMIYMTRGWAWSQGCKIERTIANVYDIDIIDAPDNLEKL